MIYNVSGDFEPINTYKNRLEYQKHKIWVPKININKIQSAKKKPYSKFKLKFQKCPYFVQNYPHS